MQIHGFEDKTTATGVDLGVQQRGGNILKFM